MTQFELLLLALFSITVLAAIAAMVAIVRGRRRVALRIGRASALGWLLYFGAVTLASAVIPQQTYLAGEDLCFDEMCFAVTGVQRMSRIGTARPSGSFYLVLIRASNHARGRTQRESGIQPLLWDETTAHRASEAGQRAWEAGHENPPLTTRIAPGESFTSVQVFDLPATAKPKSLSFDHGLTPEYLVFGESPLVRPPKIIRLDDVQ